MSLNLSKIFSDASDGLVATLRFFQNYVENLYFLTFRPKKFSERFCSEEVGRTRSASSALFLFTTIVVLEISVQLIRRVVDARNTMADIGPAMVFQSGTLWEVSWETIVERSLPLAAVLLGIAWLGARLSGSNRYERAWLRDAFPYVVWRAATLLLVLVPTSIALLVGVGMIFDPVLWYAVFFPEFALAAILVTITPILVWRLWHFVSSLQNSAASFSRRHFHYAMFALVSIASLAFPIWWSSVALSEDAEKVAVGPDSKLLIADDSTRVTVNVQLRNLAGHTLFAAKEGTEVQWWDDTHPVSEEFWFERRPIPNGWFFVDLPSEVELKDHFQTLIFTGDSAQAYLNPQSYSLFDFYGASRRFSPSEKEIADARESFQGIINGTRAGHIDVRFTVISKGGKRSRRTVTILRTEENRR